MIQHLETDCENVFRTLKHWRNAPNFPSLRRCVILEQGLHWNVLQDRADVDDGFGDITPACREYTHARADAVSRIYAAIPGREFFGPVVQVHIKQYIVINGNEIQIPSTTNPKRTSWVVICRGMDELHLKDPRHSWVVICRGMDELHFIRSTTHLSQKKANLVVQSWSNPASRKPMRRSSNIRRTQCASQAKLFLLENGGGMTSLPFLEFQRKYI